VANEITVSMSLTVNKPSVMSSAISRALSGIQFTMSGTLFIGPTDMSVGTLATPILLG
jgi:hypothetical protein